MLYHLSYASNQADDLTSSDLREILEVARSTNEKNDVTGLLLHRDKSFMQVLEGDEKTVKDLYSQIAGDARHKDVEILFSEPVEKREFSDWSMAFTELDDVTISEIPGFSDFLIDDTQPRKFLEDLSRSKRTLLLFRGMN